MEKIGAGSPGEVQRGMHCTSPGRIGVPGRPISRILSSEGVSAVHAVTILAVWCGLSRDGSRLDGHLSRRCIATTLMQPTRGFPSCEDEREQRPGLRGYLCLALLPAGVTWPPALLPAPVGSYPTFSLSPGNRLRGYRGYLFLWPCPAAYTTPDVLRRRALWSADFPLAAYAPSDHPTGLGTLIIPCPGG